MIRSYSYTPSTWNNQVPNLEPIQTEIVSLHIEDSLTSSSSITTNDDVIINNQGENLDEEEIDSRQGRDEEDGIVPMLDDNQNDLQQQCLLLSPLVKKQYGEFEIELTKVNGSLGFTLSKVGGHLQEHAEEAPSICLLYTSPSPRDS